MGVIPKKIRDAYAKMNAVIEEYNEALKKYAPEPPFKVGEVLEVKEYDWQNRFERVKIRDVQYDPYRTHRFNGWYVSAMPIKKNGENKLRRRTFRITNNSIIKTNEED